MKPYRVASRPRYGAGIWLFCLIATLAPVSAVLAETRPGAAQAQQFIADLGAEAVRVLRQPNLSLEQRETIFRGMLAQKFDLEFIGRFVLGRNWQAATPDQREEYQALFAEFVLRSYSRLLGGYVDEQLTVQGAREAGQRDVIVYSRISGSSNQPVQSLWRLRLINGQPRIIDVAAAGVSLSITQREEFAAVISRNGLEGLLEMLRARTLTLSAEGPR
jgi:phospholipid transport system substrate-binding protein